MHDGLWHEVPDALVDDGHVGVHQVADGLHLALQLGVHGEVLGGGGALALHLDRQRSGDQRVLQETPMGKWDWSWKSRALRLRLET